jgi:hypothetical protein
MAPQRPRRGAAHAPTLKVESDARIPRGRQVLDRRTALACWIGRPVLSDVALELPSRNAGELRSRQTDHDDSQPSQRAARVIEHHEHRTTY